MRLPEFYALVDAVNGQEEKVEGGLRGEAHVKAYVKCHEGNYDFLIRIEAADLGAAIGVLQTYIHPLHGVKGVERVVDWDEYGAAVRDARSRMPS